MTEGLVRRWARRGSWSLVEQVAFAAAHLAANVALARWLSGEAYGRFTALFALFVLATYGHTALVTDPLLVFARQGDHPRSYARTVLQGQIAMAGGFVLLATVASLVIEGRDGLAEGVAFGTATAALTTLWTVRKAHSAALAPRAAALGGVVYAVVVLAGLVALKVTGALGVATAFATLGAAAALVAAVLVACFGEDGPRPRLDATVRRHWRYGRWLLGMAPLRWAPLQVHFVVLPLVLAHGVALAGELRATMLLVAPMQHVQVALASLVIPAFGERRRRGAPLPLRRGAALLASASALYAGALVVAGPWLAIALFGEAFVLDRQLLALVAAIPVLTGAITFTQAALLAQERPRAMFASYLIGSLVSTLLGIGLARLQDLRGVAIAELLACGAILVVQAAAVRRSPRASTP